MGEGKIDTADLFRDLSAYLALERAEKESGFQASTYGLTDQQAADVAVVFNQYDTNQDGKLDVAEMQRLWYDALWLQRRHIVANAARRRSRSRCLWMKSRRGWGCWTPTKTAPSSLMSLCRGGSSAWSCRRDCVKLDD